MTASFAYITEGATLGRPVVCTLVFDHVAEITHVRRKLLFPRIRESKMKQKKNIPTFFPNESAQKRGLHMQQVICWINSVIEKNLFTG